ncbi:GTPase-activating protein, putative [Plasmodium vivax]|uniref:GTPase-activating protein, putative n=1 Tax=Plasmodium vivax TaxID=5855 RepID=A0A565A178_PLAVI|nr:GTPase-activating protein, putative [Plasmodium vivax]
MRAEKKKKKKTRKGSKCARTNGQYANAERSGSAPRKQLPAKTMQLKGGGGRKKDDAAAGGGATRKEAAKNEAATPKRGPPLRNPNEEMMESNDDPDSCSVYDDTVEKNINFSESILANLNDNIFEQKDSFTSEKLRGNILMLQEEMENEKRLDVHHPGEGRSSSASSSSSVRVRGGPSRQGAEAMSRGGWKTPHKGLPESSSWGALTKQEVTEEGVTAPQREQPKKNNQPTEEGKEKEKFVFPIKVSKTSWSREKAPENAHDEYNHNVIYHELYVELLQVNKSLQNEIKNLKKIIEMQKLLIKSREDVFGGSHMDEKNKVSSKKFVNNNYFLNFFNKKKKKNKESFPDVSSVLRVERVSAATSSYASVTNNEEMEEDEKAGEYFSKGGKGPSHRENYHQAHKKGEKNRRPKWERVDNNSDDEGYSEVEMNTMDNNENTHGHKNEYVKLPLSENEGSGGSENASGGGSCGDNHSDSQRGSHLGSQRTPLRDSIQGSYLFKRGNSGGVRGRSQGGGQKSYEHGYQGGKKIDGETECSEIPVNFQEITAVTLWYEEILPLINNEKKKKILIDRMISNYMPIVIKTYFWEVHIINKLNITDYFVQILIKNTKFIQSYVYTNNQQYHNHVSRYFKSLLTFRNSSLGGALSDGPAVGDDAGGEQQGEKGSSGVTDKGEKPPGETSHGETSQGNTSQEKTPQREEDNGSAGLNLLQRFSFQKFFYQILIDLDRTLYIIKKNQEYFRKHGVSTDTFLLTLDLAETKAKLNTLLQMYVVFKPELGYVQGMSYIALVFLLYCNLEKAFVHFANFMERKDIYNLYSFNNSEIKVYTYIVKEILTKQNVEIYKEIAKQYNIDNIFIQWIYTIFLTCLPFHIFIRLFDIYLFNEKIIYETILCIFTYFNKFHHVENVDVVVKNLSAFSFNTHIQEDKFWSLLKKSKIKKRKILYYREKYFKGHRDVLNEK